MEKIITRLSLSEREEKRTKLGIRNATNRAFSLWKYFFTQRKVKNKKNLFANARDVSVIKLGIGASPSILVAKVTGLTNTENTESILPSFWARITSEDNPEDLRATASLVYVNWSGKSMGDKAK